MKSTSRRSQGASDGKVTKPASLLPPPTSPTPPPARSSQRTPARKRPASTTVNATINQRNAHLVASKSPENTTSKFISAAIRAFLSCISFVSITHLCLPFALLRVYCKAKMLTQANAIIADPPTHQLETFCQIRLGKTASPLSRIARLAQAHDGWLVMVKAFVDLATQQWASLSSSPPVLFPFLHQGMFFISTSSINIDT